jgi:hypothetical protein
LTKDLWDKIIPIPPGTRVRYVRNETKRRYKKKRWFLIREAQIGNVGVVREMCKPDSFESKNVMLYFKKGKGRNLYTVHLFDEVGFFFWCLRSELEVVDEDAEKAKAIPNIY